MKTSTEGAWAACDWPDCNWPDRLKEGSAKNTWPEKTRDEAKGPGWPVIGWTCSRRAKFMLPTH